MTELTMKDRNGKYIRTGDKFRRINGREWAGNTYTAIVRNGIGTDRVCYAKEDGLWTYSSGIEKVETDRLLRKGDTVRCIEEFMDKTAWGVKGHLYEVTRDQDNRSALVLKVNGVEQRLTASRFELVDEFTAPTAVPAADVPGAKRTWIVIVVQGGKLFPASSPKEYASEAQAKAVAQSMAEKHKGQTFMVFQATGAAYVPPAPKSTFVTF